MVIVTRHAKQRLKERSGLNKKSVQRIAEKAYINGICHNETKGQLNKWIAGVYFKNSDANNIRVYGDKLYLFHDEILITVLQIPHRFTNNMADFIKKEVND